MAEPQMPRPSPGRTPCASASARRESRMEVSSSPHSSNMSYRRTRANSNVRPQSLRSPSLIKVHSAPALLKWDHLPPTMIEAATRATPFLSPRGCVEGGVLSLRRDPLRLVLPPCRALWLSSKHKLSVLFDEHEPEAKSHQKVLQRSLWMSLRPEESESVSHRVLSVRDSTAKRSRWRRRARLSALRAHGPFLLPFPSPVPPFFS